MNTYSVTLHLNSINYEIEAESKSEAIDLATERAYDEKMYDILKWASYELDEMSAE